MLNTQTVAKSYGSNLRILSALFYYPRLSQSIHSIRTPCLINSIGYGNLIFKNQLHTSKHKIDTVNEKSIKFQNTIKNDKDDLLVNYLKFANSKVNNSKLSEKYLNIVINRLQKLPQDDYITRLSYIIDYLIHQCQLELTSQNQNHQVNSKSKSDLPLDEQILYDLFDSVVDDSKNINSSLHWNLLFNILILLKNEITNINILSKSDKLIGINIDQLVQIFELSKLQADNQNKYLGILLSGKLLYLNKKIRMDKINESFFIQSLISYNYVDEALNLFESDKSYDQRWWMELGLMITLRSNNLKKFNTLFNQYDIKYKTAYPYLSPRILKLAIDKFLKVNDNSSVELFVNRFILMFEKNNNIIVDEKVASKHDQTMINFESESDANNYLNEYESISYDDLFSIMNSLFMKKKISTVSKLIEKFRLLSIPNISDDLKLLIFRFNLLEDFKKLDSLMKGNPTTNIIKEKIDYILKKCKDNITLKQMYLLKSILKIIDSSTSSSNFLLFQEYITSGMLTNTSDNIELESKKITFLIKILLGYDKEEQALNLLSKLEKDKSLISIYHFTKLVEYYYSKIRGTTSTYKKNVYLSKVNKIKENVSNLNIPFNSNFLNKTLGFYRKIHSFDPYFSTVNSIVRNKPGYDISIDNNYELFWEIWTGYFIFSKTLHSPTNKLRMPTSNSTSWHFYSKQIHKNVEDNANQIIPIRDLFQFICEINSPNNNNKFIPDSKLYSLITKTFVKHRDWNGLIAVLLKQSMVHDQTMNKNIVDYILIGLEKEYILLELDALEADSQNNVLDTALAKATSIIAQQKKDNLLFDKLTDEQMSDNGETFKYINNEIIKCLRKRAGHGDSFCDIEHDIFECMNKLGLTLKEYKTLLPGNQTLINK